MKFKATKKEMRQYNKIISIGYGDAQYLLSNQSPIAYSAGVYGWSCDYYDIDGILISTGYQPLKAKNTSDTTENYNLLLKLDKQAREISHNYKIDYEKQKKQIDKLLSKFIGEVVQ